MQKESQNQRREVVSQKLEMKGKKDEHIIKNCVRELYRAPWAKKQHNPKNRKDARQILKNKKLLYDFWHYKTYKNTINSVK